MKKSDLLKPNRIRKERVTEQIRREFERTGPNESDGMRTGQDSFFTTAFISSAFLTTIAFCLIDGFFKKYTIDELLIGIVFFIARFLAALLLIVSGVVIYQTIKESSHPEKNLKIYWIVLIVGTLCLIAFI